MPFDAAIGSRFAANSATTMRAGIGGPVVVPRFKAICTKRRGSGVPSVSNFGVSFLPGGTKRIANAGRYSRPGLTSYGTSGSNLTLRTRRLARRALETLESGRTLICLSGRTHSFDFDH